MVHMNDHNNTD